MITEPPFNPKSIQKVVSLQSFYNFMLTFFFAAIKLQSMDEIVFEKHGFMAFYRTCPQMLACQGFQREHPSFGLCLILDLFVDHFISETKTKTTIYIGLPLLAICCIAQVFHARWLSTPAFLSLTRCHCFTENR